MLRGNRLAAEAVGGAGLQPGLFTTTSSETKRLEADRRARPRGAIENPLVVAALQPSRALALGRIP